VAGLLTMASAVRGAFSRPVLRPGYSFYGTRLLSSRLRARR